MTAVPLASVSQIGADCESSVRGAGWAEPRQFATGAAGLVHTSIAPLLGALQDAIADAAARGINDTGARRAADQLRDAQIALGLAIAAAGRALAHRDVRIAPAA